MKKAQEFLKMLEEDEEGESVYYAAGDWVIVEPTGSSLRAEYPATNWLKRKQRVQLVDDAVEGTLDVFDVKTEDGEEQSVYGFNIVGEA